MTFLTCLNPALATTFSGTLVLLVTATLIANRLDRRRATPVTHELVQRVRTWWIIAVPFFGALISGPAVTLAFFAFVSFLALKEYFSLIPTRRADRRVLLYVYACIAVQYGWVHLGWYGMFAIFIPVYMSLFLPLRMVLSGENEGFLSAAGTLLWGLMTTVYGLSHVGALLLLRVPTGAAPASAAPSGASLVLYVVFLTQWNDVMQYVWGRNFGKTKVVPWVSPGKTWAGLLGGVGTTVTLAVAAAPYLTPFTRIESIFVGLLIGFGGFIGDITLSAVKRDLGRKDSGSMLPGHGGILDRVNSLTCTAPLFFHFTRYLHY